MRKIAILLIALILLPGCATIGGPNDPVHQSTLMTEIISDPPGAKIEINSEYVGDTPLSTHIVRKYDGFLGSWEGFWITANPTQAGQYVQRKFIVSGEPTPKRVYFNMDLGPVSPQVDVNVNQ